MAKDETKQLTAKVMDDDKDVYIALKAIPDYVPANAAYSKDALDDSFEAMEAARAREVEAKVLWAAARDNKVAAEWAFHNKALGGKVQVEAQFGPNSNQFQSLKMKKKSEYKSGGGGKKGGEAKS
ncbi:MAG: hypothetical protein QOF02_2544 [Blastocatellia bacterium]|jgi:hypothetical protein|nr:hypothetical protein [Blastocatellia bacterium]